MIYLDNAATSFPKPEPVYQAMDQFARTKMANPGRAGHRMAVAAERTLDEGRHVLNQFFHGAGTERWIFTLNCTDALNLAIKGTVQPRRPRRHLRPRTQLDQPPPAETGKRRRYLANSRGLARGVHRPRGRAGGHPTG